MYRIGDDLSLIPLHKSLGQIVKILLGDDEDIILIGKSHIEMVNSRTGNSTIWWKNSIGEQEIGEQAIFHNGHIYICCREKLVKFVPPE